MFWVVELNLWCYVGFHFVLVKYRLDHCLNPCGIKTAVLNQLLLSSSMLLQGDGLCWGYTKHTMCSWWGYWVLCTTVCKPVLLTPVQMNRDVVGMFSLLLTVCGKWFEEDVQRRRGDLSYTCIMTWKRLSDITQCENEKCSVHLLLRRNCWRKLFQKEGKLNSELLHLDYLNASLV